MGGGGREPKFKDYKPGGGGGRLGRAEMFRLGGGGKMLEAEAGWELIKSVGAGGNELLYSVLYWLGWLY